MEAASVARMATAVNFNQSKSHSLIERCLLSLRFITGSRFHMRLPAFSAAAS
jgi:hypothetical protein